MATISNRFDPWGPISAVLYGINDSEFVQDAVAMTGVDVHWRSLNKAEAYSHSTRIRAHRQDISAAYARLREDQKGHFSQIVAKAMLNRHDSVNIRAKLTDALKDIGWVIADNDLLRTEDALVAEQFFPLNSPFDAYVSIRDVLSRATQDIMIVDGYLGSSLLLTLRSLANRPPEVRLLTVEKNLKADFPIEIAAFRKQIGGVTIEVKAAPDFHDRFIVIDRAEFYHLGASIKDAGKRAFMISRIEDPSNVESVRQAIIQAWTSATVLAL